MAWQNLSIVMILALAALVASLIAFYARRRGDAPGATYLVLLMLAVAIWSAFVALEFASVEASTKIWWSKLSYLGAVSVSPLWFLFALSYSQQASWLKNRWVILLWILPLSTFLLALTNEFHGLIWPKIYPYSGLLGAPLVYEHGIAFYVYIVYGYLLMLLGTVLLIRTTLHTSQLYRQQVAAILISAAIPWVGNFLYILGFSPTPGLDLAPVFFTISGLLLVWGIYRYQILDLVPVARDAMVENMNEGLLVLDNHEKIVDLNPAASRLLNVNNKHMIGKPVTQLLADWPMLLAKSQGSSHPQEINLTGDQWLELLISPLQAKRPRLSGWLVVLRDITTRTKAEATLIEYTRELESRNAELDTFSHTVAHDLKNSLSVLVNSSSLLDAYLEKMDRQQITALTQANIRTANKMANIIDELLLLANLRKKAELTVNPLDMEAIVSEALSRLVDESSERHAQIHIPDEWPVALGYAPWVEEVWVNLINNALKYGSTPPRIDIGYDPQISSPRATPEAQVGDWQRQVRFWVQDNGIGVKPEDQSRLFIEFSRLDQVHTEGHGLGLSIVRRIVEKLGGIVGVESQPGQGSRFYFTLPLSLEILPSPDINQEQPAG